MGDALEPIDFLNPLTPFRLGSRGATVAGRVVSDAAKSGVDTAARGVATATQPLATAAGDVAGFLSVVAHEAGETARDTTKKLLIGEMVLVGGVVAIALTAAWYYSRSPEARAATGRTVLAGTKLLLTKGG